VAAAHEDEARLRLALELLEPLDQRIVSEHTYRDATFVALGQELGMTEDAVRMRFNRAVRKLSEKVLQLRNGQIDGFLGG
jgi:DNA-directed RNA polymerase specialized sigma24 family protein